MMLRNQVVTLRVFRYSQPRVFW